MNIGVIVGRFQVASLHEGHRTLINTALRNHERVIVFIGVPFFEGTTTDPLDYETRAKMVQAEFPTVTVLPIRDVPSDEVWSQILDESIKAIFPRVSTVVMYSGRDGFIQHYKGCWKTVEIADFHYTSGTTVREAIGKNPRYSEDFRAGQIYAKENQWPFIRMAVDIVIWKQEKGQILFLVGKKPYEKSFRFPGGFVDKEDASLEYAAKRELGEECPNIVCDKLEYIGSMPVEDYRLNDKKSIIHTAVFMGQAQWGATTAGDDLAHLEYQDVKLLRDTIRHSHSHIYRLARKALKI